MFEYTWQIPGDPPEDVVLRIHSRSGWLGRKELVCNGQTVFRRGRLGGIEARFRAGAGGHELALRFLPAGEPGLWRPALFCDGVELPERGGGPLPRVPHPPRVLAVVVGLVYLLMFLAVVTLPSTVKILRAVYGPGDPDYSAGQHIAPWIVPFLATAAGLLGVLNMRRWAVFMFGAFILAQVVLRLVTPLPVSGTALTIECALWLCCAAYLGRMQ